MNQTKTLQPATITRVNKMVRIFCVMLICVAMFSCVAFASDAADAAGAIQTGIKTGTQQLYNIITAIVVPIAVVVFAWNGIKMFIGSEREIESAKKTMLITALAIAVVYLAPVIIQQVAGWFSSTGDAGVFS